MKDEPERPANGTQGIASTTSLFELIGRWDARAAEALAGSHPDALHERDAHGHTPLLAAAARGAVEAVAGLLHLAAQGGSAEVVRLLLDRGLGVNAQAPSHGLTPLMTAVWHRHPEVVALMLDRPEVDVSVRARFGASAEDLIDASAVTSKVKKAESDEA